MRVTFGLVAALLCLVNEAGAAVAQPAENRHLPFDLNPRPPKALLGLVQAAAYKANRRDAPITKATSCSTVSRTRVCTTVTGTASTSCSGSGNRKQCSTAVVPVPVSTSTTCVGNGRGQSCTTVLVPSPTISVAPVITSSSSCSNVGRTRSCTTVTGTFSTSCSGTGGSMKCTSQIVPVASSSSAAAASPPAASAPTASAPTASATPQVTAPVSTESATPASSSVDPATAVPTTEIVSPTSSAASSDIPVVSSDPTSVAQVSSDPTSTAIPAVESPSSAMDGASPSSTGDAPSSAIATASDLASSSIGPTATDAASSTAEVSPSSDIPTVTASDLASTDIPTSTGDAPSSIPTVTVSDPASSIAEASSTSDIPTVTPITASDVASSNSAPTATQTASTDVPTTAATTASDLASSVSSDTPTSTASASASAIPVVVAPIGGATLENRILVLARDAYGAESGYHGLEGYGIPYDYLLVPQEGVALPALNDSATHGLWSGIIVMDALSYEYSTGWASAVTADQWTALSNYQVMFNVRMVRINEYPGPSFGASAVGGSGDDQPISLTDTSDFPTANLKTGAGLSSAGLWHYPATVTDTATTKVVATFAADATFPQAYAAAVINSFADGRQQWVWFTSWAPQWSTTCAALQHAHIHWLTRGLFLGKRKIHLNIQIDDVELETDMYSPAGTVFRLRPADLDGHITWMNDLNSRLPAGSQFRIELAHNGNGDIIYGTDPGSHGVCTPDYAVDYPEIIDTALEFQKPLGTGVDFWPAEWTTYPWTAQCTKLDPLTSYYLDTAKRDAFSHVSHTFTHMELNNATYHDAAREIQFNQAWLSQTGIAAGTFSPHGLIPPAITGLHNGDVIQAWMDNGITHVVGDNTRPILRSTDSPYHPLISTVAGNGYDGLVIVPRWATSIYYNCDTWECDVAEWKNISAGYGDYTDLLANAQQVNVPYLLALKADPYMFHQANLRFTDMSTISVGTQTGKMSMVMGWVESVAQELARITNWPIVSLKHDDFAQYFIDRMNLDNCKPSLSFTLNEAGNAITHVTVSAADLNCVADIPVTIPSGSATGATRSDQVGTEPPIQWVKLNNAPVTLALDTPVSV